MIIAIDGTSGSGKSTIARQLAKKLNFGFFSAGDLYRALTVKVLTLQISEDDEKQLTDLARTTKVVYTYDGNKNSMFVDSMNVTDKLHKEEVSNLVSKIACKPYIREFVRKLQRETAENNENIVMEGRDIGSVIFPDADLKIFVDCNIETRAKRRMQDFIAIGEKVPLEKVIEELKERDHRDMHRTISPLVMCENAYLLDTSYLSIEECLNSIIKRMMEKGLIGTSFLEERGITL